jgi:hypothetical protein
MAKARYPTTQTTATEPGERRKLPLMLESRDRTALDLVALHGALIGKRLMAHTDRDVGIKLDEAFAGGYTL